jgi:serine/threonine protein kinase
VEKIRNYTEQILKCLTFLEQRQIIHCDLKPENIILCDALAEKIKVVDFGSGCFTDEQLYSYV